MPEAKTAGWSTPVEGAQCPEPFLCDTGITCQSWRHLERTPSVTVNPGTRVRQSQGDPGRESTVLGLRIPRFWSRSISTCSWLGTVGMSLNLVDSPFPN